jgi:hypothetical protein
MMVVTSEWSAADSLRADTYLFRAHRCRGERIVTCTGDRDEPENFPNAGIARED